MRSGRVLDLGGLLQPPGSSGRFRAELDPPSFTGAGWGPRMAPGTWRRGGPGGRSVRLVAEVAIGRLLADGLLGLSACPPLGLPPTPVVTMDPGLGRR